MSKQKDKLFLKDCIADAMIRLMDDKPLEKITAKEITELAGVGRATFFRHFESKREVLIFKLKRLWGEWAQEHKLTDESKFSLLTSEEFFAFNISIRPFLCKIYKAGMQTTIYEAFYQIMESHFGTDTVPCYANHFYSYGTFGLLDEWIKRGFKETPEQMAKILIDQIVGQNIFMA